MTKTFDELKRSCNLKFLSSFFIMGVNRYKFVIRLNENKLNCICDLFLFF